MTNKAQKQPQKQAQKQPQKSLEKKSEGKIGKLSKKDGDYLNEFSWMGFFFPAITCFWSNQKGKGIGLLILKILIISYVALNSTEFNGISSGFNGTILIFIIFSIPGFFVGKTIRKKLYETGKYDSIDEFKSFMKKRTKIMVIIGIMTTLGLPIILLGIYIVVFLIAVGLVGWH